MTARHCYGCIGYRDHGDGDQTVCTGVHIADIDPADLARALVSSDLMIRYSEYAQKAHPNTMAFEPVEDLAAEWADAIILAARFEAITKEQP